MKRFLLIAGLAALVTPLSLPAQYPYQPGGAGGAEQMVQEWYGRFLGRAADPQAAGWINLLQSGHAPDAVLAQLLASPEYYLRGGSTPQGFVQRLHIDLTGRPPGPGETAAWVRQLYSHDRQDVAYQMLQRYPQNWGGSPGEDYRPEPTHDYRRPFYRYLPHR